MERGNATPALVVFPRFEPVLDSRTKNYIMKGRLFKGTIQTYMRQINLELNLKSLL
jgi:hypothetical protein